MMGAWIKTGSAMTGPNWSGARHVIWVDPIARQRAGIAPARQGRRRRPNGGFGGPPLAITGVCIQAESGITPRENSTPWTPERGFRLRASKRDRMYDGNSQRADDRRLSTRQPNCGVGIEPILQSCHSRLLRQATRAGPFETFFAGSALYSAIQRRLLTRGAKPRTVRSAKHLPRDNT